MDREAKTVKARAATKPPAARRSRSRARKETRSVEQRLADALAQQAATSEILRVMSASPTDVQPVMDAVAQQAAHLCHASFARVILVEGDMMRPLAQYVADREFAIPMRAVPAKRTSIAGRATLDRVTVHHADIVPLLDSDYPDARANAMANRIRAVLAVPLMRQGEAYGAIFLWRQEPGLFAPDQVALVETFAAQAAIAIENVRLFHEEQARSRELAESLQQQTATNEVLKVISRSTFDLQAVLHTLVESAARLCGADRGTITRQKGGRFYRAEAYGYSSEFMDYIKDIPIEPERGSATGRALLEGRVVHIPDVLADPDYTFLEAQKLGAYRSILGVPMMREGVAMGVIALTRSEVQPFTDKQIELVSTFADQAVIAIENVRLFSELEARNHDLTETLEQQTATSDILRVISQSPTDVQPVFDTIARAALELCSASGGLVFTFDGELVHLAAYVSLDRGYIETLRRIYPRPLGRDAAVLRAIQTRSVVMIPDVLEDEDYNSAIGSLASAGGFRCVLAVPLIRDGSPIGAIAVGRPTSGHYSERQVTLLGTFADQAVIAIENVRLFNELDARNRDLTEALEQQTASSEILRVISQSQTDVQPVFDTIAAATMKLCRVSLASVYTFDGELIHLAAFASVNVLPEYSAAIRQNFPRPPSRDTAVTRAVLTGEVVVIPDVLEDAEYAITAQTLAGGFRSVLAVPLIREGKPIGAIVVGGAEPGLFPDKQIALLQTFADQAVIAIENVRLFKELEARNHDLTVALEQQTATSDILRVISQSQTDVRPVFETIVDATMKLCRASSANVYTFDGELIHLAALVNVNLNVNPEYFAAIHQAFPRPPGRDTAVGRAVLARNIVMIPDVLDDPEYAILPQTLAGGFRSVMAVPLMREENPIGAIIVGGPEPGPFPDAQIALLKTFADQAVIAIENVRLFKELEARNRDLTEALEQQTATSDILRVISQSQTDVRPVFDTIAKASQELCGAGSASVYTFDGELVHLVSIVPVNPASDALRQFFPRPPSRDTAVLRAILTHSVVAIPDVLDDKEYLIGTHAAAGGFRSVLAVPLIRDGNAIGGIAVGRAEPGLFHDTQVALLQTFADQAVIAIENARLFRELAARNRDLTEALEQQTATSDILRVISQSQTDVQPVFDTIVRCVRSLCDATFSGVYLLDGETLSIAATTGMTDEERAAFHSGYPRRIGPDTVAGHSALERRVIQTHDLINDPQYASAPGSRVGARTVLGVPLMRDGKAIGAIGVWRAEIKPFSETQIALLQTFADQAVIAIENVRLFKELEARTADLTRSVGELKALGDVGQAVSSTLDLETVLSTIVSRATQLAGVDGGSIYEYDEVREEFYLHTTDHLPDELVEAMRATPMPKGEGILGRMALTAEPVQIPDIMDEGSYQSRVREHLIRLGYRSLLAVPLLRENHLLGGLAVNRKRPGEFDASVIELLKTFATQSALAIQNARLFREIEAKGRLLETASRHKSEFLANMSHELRTPLNAIIGFSEVLSEKLFGEMNEKQTEYVGDISESGKHLLNLINDILDLSKIEAGRLELDPSDFDIATTIDSTLSLVRERAQRRAITLCCTVGDGLKMVHADERKVRQVLLNLLSNALKFTPEGGAIDIRATAHDDRTEIAVTDTGVGIAPEDHEAVFEEFRQVGSTAKKIEGTGLGLAISRKFIELHGGRISVRSQLGSGSTFTFTLPRR